VCANDGDPQNKKPEIAGGLIDFDGETERMELLCVAMGKHSASAANQLAAQPSEIRGERALELSNHLIDLHLANAQDEPRRKRARQVRKQLP